MHDRARHGDRIDADIARESPIPRRDRCPRHAVRHLGDPLTARPIRRQRLVQHHAMAIGDDRRRVARDGREGAEADPQRKRDHHRHPERERGTWAEGRHEARDSCPPAHQVLRYAQDDVATHGCTSTTTDPVLPNTSGSYISSALAGAVTNVPAVVARTMYVNSCVPSPKRVAKRLTRSSWRST